MSVYLGSRSGNDSRCVSVLSVVSGGVAGSCGRRPCRCGGLGIVVTPTRRSTSTIRVAGQVVGGMPRRAEGHCLLWPFRSAAWTAGRSRSRRAAGPWAGAREARTTRARLAAVEGAGRTTRRPLAPAPDLSRAGRAAASVRRLSGCAPTRCCGPASSPSADVRSSRRGAVGSDQAGCRRPGAAWQPAQVPRQRTERRLEGLERRSQPGATGVVAHRAAITPLVVLPGRHHSSCGTTRLERTRGRRRHAGAGPSSRSTPASAPAVQSGRSECDQDHGDGDERMSTDLPAQVGGFSRPRARRSRPAASVPGA
jgi:hypothetical protein